MNEHENGLSGMIERETRERATETMLGAEKGLGEVPVLQENTGCVHRGRENGRSGVIVAKGKRLSRVFKPKWVPLFAEREGAVCKGKVLRRESYVLVKVGLAAENYGGKDTGVNGIGRVGHTLAGLFGNVGARVRGTDEANVPRDGVRRREELAHPLDAGKAHVRPGVVCLRARQQKVLQRVCHLCGR